MPSQSLSTAPTVHQSVQALTRAYLDAVKALAAGAPAADVDAHQLAAAFRSVSSDPRRHRALVDRVVRRAWTVAKGELPETRRRPAMTIAELHHGEGRAVA